MEETSLKNVMEKITSEIKQVRDVLEEQAKTFDLGEFLQLLNSETKGRVNLSDFMTSMNSGEPEPHVTCSIPINLSSVSSGPSISSEEPPKRQDLRDLMNQLMKNEKEATSINEQIQCLSAKDKKLFWAMYHGIPLDETSMKLDTVISSLTTLNTNIVNNFNYKERLEDILDEIEILRQEIRSKPTVEESQ